MTGTTAVVLCDRTVCECWMWVGMHCQVWSHSVHSVSCSSWVQPTTSCQTSPILSSCWGCHGDDCRGSTSAWMRFASRGDTETESSPCLHHWVSHSCWY